MASVLPQKQFSPTKSVFNQDGTSENNNRNNKIQSAPVDEDKCFRQNIQELDLQGISRYCNNQYGTFRRAFWGILWLVFTMCCAYNFAMGLTRLLYNPTMVDTSYVENLTIAPPCVTICPTDKNFRNPAISEILLSAIGGNLSYKNAYDLLLNSNMTTEELWNISRIVFPNELYGMSQMEEGSILNGYEWAGADVEKTEIVTVTGICVIYKPKIDMQCIGMQSGLAIKDMTEWDKVNSSSSNMYSVVFHSEAEIPMLHYFGPLLIGSYLELGHANIAALKVQEVTKLNRMYNPCVPEEVFTRCTIRCLEDKLLNTSLTYKVTPCRLPFMMDSVGLPPCRTANDFLAMYKATEETIRSFERKLCNCKAPCKQRYYREDYYNKIKINEMFALYVTVPRCIVERSDEKVHYDFSAFFSDVGGALGLLLGLSMLNVVEIVEVVFLKIFTVK